MRKYFYTFLFLVLAKDSFCWGFYAHRKINYFAVFLLPPEMMVLYKPQIDLYLDDHGKDIEEMIGVQK